MSDNNHAYFASKLKNILKTDKKKVRIQAYISYGSSKIIHVRGRVLKDAEIVTDEKDSYFKSIKNIWKRIESDELPLQDLTVSFRDVKQTIKTNTEGFFHWSVQLKKGQTFKEFEKVEFRIAKEQIPEKYLQVNVTSNGLLLFPDSSADYGVISDIDDTILKTEVLSAYKLKALYNTLFIKASKRMPISYANSWYQKLRKGKGKAKNPIFYISNSPWNIYNYLRMFLKINKFPRGPILLRDFGLRTKAESIQEYKDHKKTEITRLLETYPKLSFILIGDGGEFDADIYLAIKGKFKKRIRAIFIHRLGNKKHQARIEKLAEGQENFFFISDAKEATKISREMGLID